MKVLGLCLSATAMSVTTAMTTLPYCPPGCVSICPVGLDGSIDGLCLDRTGNSVRRPIRAWVEMGQHQTVV